MLISLSDECVLAGDELVINHHIRALCEKFLIFGMVLGMGMRFSKMIANNLRAPPSGLFAINQILDRPVYG